MTSCDCGPKCTKNPCLIDMVAYRIIHNTGDRDWRCTSFSHDDTYSAEDIITHLTDGHGIPKQLLKITHDGEIFVCDYRKGGRNG